MSTDESEFQTSRPVMLVDSLYHTSLYEWRLQEKGLIVRMEENTLIEKERNHHMSSICSVVQLNAIMKQAD